MPAHPGPQPSSGRIGDHVLVLGASMAGLLTARVLADRYGQVTVIDRDQLPQTGSHRRGVPHGPTPMRCWRAASRP
jgi:glycine/D-amino acid oxidase-like deaminating enzyme